MSGDSFLPTEGIHNLRDYGGYRATDGARVRSGLLFRSGQHASASEGDLAIVDGLNLRMVIDLRGLSERESFPCRRSGKFDAQVIAFPGETTSAPPHEIAAGKGLSADDARRRMIAVYTRMPENPAMTAMFGRYLDALANSDGASLVHCFAGKDRTGIAASLLLHILGVHRDDIYREFLLTNAAPTRSVLRAQALPRLEERYGSIASEAVDNLLGVRADYLDTWFASTARAHGSLDLYLDKAIGVDRAQRKRLRENFLT